MHNVELLRYKELVHNLNDAILVENEHRIIVIANQAFCDLFQIEQSPEDIVGIDCSDSAEYSKHLFLDPDGFVNGVEKHLSNKVPVTNETIKLTGGRVVERDYIPVFDQGKYVGHLWVYKDLTHRYELEYELIKARKKAEDANQIKSNFVAAVSHDLRQPLQAIIFGIDTLKVNQAEMSSFGMFKHIESCASNMSNILNDLLDITKLESGEIKPRKHHFLLAELFMTLKEQYEPLFRNKQLKFDIQKTNNCVFEDRNLLYQVLSNFVSNALRYTFKGGVNITSVESNSNIMISIEDTGIGIDKDHLPKIFTDFYQVKSKSSQNESGLGLGLSIVTKLAQLNGWKIKATSQKGKGSRFSVTVNKGNAHLVNRELTSYSEKPFKDITILVIDDDLKILEIMSDILTSWGCNVLAIADADNFTSLVEQDLHFDIDVILSDYRFSDEISGLDLIKDIETRIKTKVPTFILTADTSKEVKEKVSAKHYTYVSKPVFPAKLRVLLNSALN